MAIEFQLVGGEYKSLSPLVNNQELVNMYPVVNSQGGRPTALYMTPGLKEWKRFDGNNSEVRSLSVVKDDILCAVIGRKVYFIYNDKTSFEFEDTLSSLSGQIQIESDEITYAVILDASNNSLHYTELLNPELVNISLPTGVVPGTLTFQSGYWIVNDKNSDYFYISSAYDPTSWSALDFKAAEYKGDKIVAMTSDHNELVAFGTKTKESFYNSGESFPFAKIQGSDQEVGLAGPAAFTAIDNSLYWLDEKGYPRFADQYVPMYMPGSQVSYRMSRLQTINDCIVFSYNYEGRSFVIFTFPTENKTWVYEISTRQWHRRSSFPFGTDGRWRANCYEFFMSKHLIGDYENGKIYELDHTIFTENGQIMTALRTCPAISSSREFITFNSMELHIQSGGGISTGQGSDPMVMMRYSDDNGRTWSNELWRSMGKIGEYETRVKWNRLGRAIERQFEFSITDPVPRIFIGGFINGGYR